MKNIFFSVLFSLLFVASFAQTETFDLTSYTAPKGWKKAIEQNITSYTSSDSKTNTWCRINIIRSTGSKGDITQDFESEWQEMIIKNYKPADAPQVNEVKEANGWKIKAGGAKFVFNNKHATVLLTTATGYNRCASIIVVTNTEDYLKDVEAFLASVTLKKPEINPLQTTVGNASVIGSWGKSNTINQLNNRFGNYNYNKQQYSFKANGSYSFTAKTYDEQQSETLLIKGKGNYVIVGNTITITPKNSVIEAWSKKNGSDNWNQLKSTQKRTLEIVSYQFTITNNNLQLQTTKQTERDGKFNHGNTYTYGPPGTFTPIKLPGE
jgi:hypothetical protein